MQNLEMDDVRHFVLGSLMVGTAALAAFGSLAWAWSAMCQSGPSREQRGWLRWIGGNDGEKNPAEETRQYDRSIETPSVIASQPDAFCGGGTHRTDEPGSGAGTPGPDAGQTAAPRWMGRRRGVVGRG